MKVLIIPEDPALDSHVLKPVVERIFAELGRVARVDVLTDPHLRGVAQALDADTVRQIVEDNRMVDLFLLMVDRDCDRDGNVAKAAGRVSAHAGKLLACLAEQEVEVWPLALHRDDVGAPWREVHAHCDPKEAYWDPFVAKKRWLGEVGKGRKRAMRELGAGWSGLLKLCPEIARLQDDIGAWLSGVGAG